MKKKDEIEDLFKDSFKDFEAEVSPGIWTNIQTVLKGAGIGLLIKTLLNKIGTNTIVAIISSAAAVISTVVVMNWNNSEQKKSVKTNPIVVQNPKPEKVEEIKKFLSQDPEKTNTEDASVLNSETPKKHQKFTPIKKEKIHALINEYKESKIAAIAANPIGGTVPLVVNLTNNGTGKINNWNFGDGQKDSNTNPVHVYDVPGVYTIALTSTNADGTIAVDSVKVEVTGNSSLSSMQGSFSPNGDGVQDSFSFKYVNVVNMSAVVFDQNGTALFTGDSDHNKWDGKDLNGKDVKAGTYFYYTTAQGIDGKKFEIKGKIVLTR